MDRREPGQDAAKRPVTLVDRVDVTGRYGFNVKLPINVVRIELTT